MRIQHHTAWRTTLRAFAAPARCPSCGDMLVAPVLTEFVEGDEIRHHWECDTCGIYVSTSVPLTAH